MKPQVEETVSYKCNWCNSIHRRKFDAGLCAFKHARANLANTMLQEGQTLGSIVYWCGFDWVLSEEQKAITRDSCFIVPHWQCCEKPAYRIVSIDGGGWLHLWGIGSSLGGYGSLVSIDRLPKPHPKEEFYRYK